MQSDHPQTRSAVPNPRSFKRSGVIAAILWLLFIGGLAIQGFAPRLKIEHRAFIMPEGLTEYKADIRPDLIVQHERAMQWASGLCTLGGALALAFWYRRPLAEALQLKKFPN